MSQNKFNVAVTVAMGSKMDAVVVQDEKTAIECIQYMKEQRVGIATFLPLDTLKVRGASLGSETQTHRPKTSGADTRHRHQT